MNDNDRFRGNLFSDKVLKEVVGKRTRRDKIKVEEIADTHTIDVASMTLILGRIEELYKVAAKLNEVGLTAAAVDIVESIGEIEKAVLSNPVDTIDIDELSKVMDEHNRQHHLDPTTPLEGYPMDDRPIGIPPYNDGGTGGQIWRYETTASTPTVGLNTIAREYGLPQNPSDYVEVMRRAYERLDNPQDD